MDQTAQYLLELLQNLERLENREAVNQAMLPTIDYEVKINDLTPHIFKRVQLGKGQLPKFKKLPESKEAMLIAHGGQPIPVVWGKLEEIEVPMRRYMDEIELQWDEVQDNTDYSLADASKKLAQGVTRSINSTIINLLNATKTRMQYRSLGTAPDVSTIEAAVDEVIGLVEDQVDKARAILIKGSAFAKMKKFVAFANAALEEIRKTGVIGVYSGAQIIKAKEVPKNVIIIIPDNVNNAQYFERTGWVGDVQRFKNTVHVWGYLKRGYIIGKPEEFGWVEWS